MTLETVLLGIGHEEADRLDRLAQTVSDIAVPAAATVELLHVFSEDEFDSAVARLDYPFESEATPDEVAKRHESVKTVVELLEDDGVDYNISGAVGDHSSLIVDEAASLAADLVVIGGEKQSPAGKAMFGSTAQDVLLNAHCPVVFVKAED